jgi:outer membrane protein OmpA-like peptidoglycan-associated protein
MNTFRQSLLACLFTTMFSFGLTFPARADEDSDKLEALQKALKAPATEAEAADPAKKKRRTRAIVFDNADEPAAAPAGQATRASGGGGAVNCAGVNADTQGVAVDFAIQFNVGSATIAPTSEALLDQIGKILSMNPSGCIVVEGHTDVSGNFEKNMALSASRADSVVKYLGKSIDSTRLMPLGKGSTQPLKDLDARHPKNRRVVFKVVG